MSKPKLLDAYTPESLTVGAVNASYTEVGEWADSNPDNEDRIGYFVSVDNTNPGITMVKATSTSDVRGVTMMNPGFSANASMDKYDESGNLLPKYSYVGFTGFVPVIDNGTCTVNGRCMPDDDGTAIPSTNNLGYQVIDRIDDTHVLILVEPQGDMIQRIKEDITGLSDEINQISKDITVQQSSTTTFNPDGSITEIREDNSSLTTIFNPDGSITELSKNSSGQIIQTEKTNFNADGSITKEVSK